MEAKDIIERKSILARDKEVYKNLWQEIAMLMAPERADFSRAYGLGTNRHRHIWDGTGEHALDIFATSVLGIVANPASRWFTIETTDEETNKKQDVSEWLDLAGRICLNALNQPQAKFYGYMKTTLRTLGAFGTAGLSVMPGSKSKLDFMPMQLGKLEIAQDYGGTVDTKYITCEYSARQLKQMQAYRAKLNKEFKLHKKIEDAKPEDKFEIIHAIFPREDYKKDMFGAENLPVASVWVDVRNAFVMSVDGFDEDPLPVGRWDVAGDEVWGRGRGEVALADVKLINTAEKGLMLAMEKQLNPTLQVPSDGTYGAIDLSPGAINAIMTRDGRGANVLESTGNLPIAMDWMRDKRDSIRNAFFVDQLQMVGNTQMTATEVMQRNDHRNRLLAPNIGMIYSELVGPIVERVLGILQRDGTIPPPPKELAGQDVKVVYVSPLTRAQRESESAAITNFLQQVAGIAQINPDILDTIDIERAVKELHDIEGVPAAVLRSDDEVAAIRNAKAQAAQQQQMLAGAEQVSKVAKNAKDAGML